MPSIAIGSDIAGYELKEAIKAYLVQLGYEYTDFGVGSGEDIDYPEIALELAKSISAGRYERGILVCGTGIGMAIVANKVGGVRAAICHDTYSAERARKSNNAQILTMGARVIGVELAKSIVNIWLHSEFEGGRSSNKVKLVDQIDDSYRKTQ